MLTGAHVGSTGARMSYGGIATLPNLGPRQRLGITGPLGPDSAAKAALLRSLVSPLTSGATRSEPRLGG